MHRLQQQTGHQKHTAHLVNKFKTYTVGQQTDRTALEYNQGQGMENRTHHQWQCLHCHHCHCCLQQCRRFHWSHLSCHFLRWHCFHCCCHQFPQHHQVQRYHHCLCRMDPVLHYCCLQHSPINTSQWAISGWKECANKLVSSFGSMTSVWKPVWLCTPPWRQSDMTRAAVNSTDCWQVTVTATWQCSSVYYSLLAKHAYSSAAAKMQCHVLLLQNVSEDNIPIYTFTYHRVSMCSHWYHRVLQYAHAHINIAYSYIASILGWHNASCKI